MYERVNIIHISSTPHNFYRRCQRKTSSFPALTYKVFRRHADFVEVATVRRLIADTVLTFLRSCHSQHLPTLFRSWYKLLKISLSMCNCFFSLVTFPNILPSNMTHSKFCCLKMCQIHLYFCRWTLSKMRPLSSTLWSTSSLLILSIQLIFSIILHPTSRKLPTFLCKLEIQFKRLGHQKHVV